MTTYQNKIDVISQFIAEEDKKQNLNRNYYPRRMISWLKCKTELIPANIDDKRKLYILASFMDILNCRNCPDMDNINNSLGDLTDEIYSLPELELAWQCCINLRMVRAKKTQLVSHHD